MNRSRDQEQGRRQSGRKESIKISPSFKESPGIDYHEHGHKWNDKQPGLFPEPVCCMWQVNQCSHGECHITDYKKTTCVFCQDNEFEMQS